MSANVNQGEFDGVPPHMLRLVDDVIADAYPTKLNQNPANTDKKIPHALRPKSTSSSTQASTNAAPQLSWGRILAVTRSQAHHSSVSVSGVTYHIGDFCRLAGYPDLVSRIDMIVRPFPNDVAASATIFVLRRLMTPMEAVHAIRSKRLLYQLLTERPFEERELIWTDNIQVMLAKVNALEPCKVFSRDRYLASHSASGQSPAAAIDHSGRDRTYFVTRCIRPAGSRMAQLDAQPDACVPLDEELKPHLSTTSFEADQRRPVEVCYTTQPESLFQAVPLRHTNTEEQTKPLEVRYETLAHGVHTYCRNGFAIFDTLKGERVAQIKGFDLSPGGKVSIDIAWLYSPSHPGLNGRYDTLLPIDPAGRVMPSSRVVQRSFDIGDMRIRMMPNRPCQVMDRRAWNKKKANGDNMKDVFFWIRTEPRIVTQPGSTSSSTNKVNGETHLADDSDASDYSLSEDDCADGDADMHGEGVSEDRAGPCASLTLANGDVIRAGEFYRSTEKDHHHQTMILRVDGIHTKGDKSFVRFRRLLYPSLSHSTDHFDPDELLWSRQSMTAHVSGGKFDSGRVLEPCRVMAREEYFRSPDADDHTKLIYFVTRMWNTKERECTDIDDEVKKKLSQPMTSMSSSSTACDPVDSAAAGVSSLHVGIASSDSSSSSTPLPLPTDQH